MTVAPDGAERALASLQRAIVKGDAAAVRRLLIRSPSLLGAYPAKSADLVSLALRVVSSKADASLVDRPEHARAALESQRELVDLLLEHGASIDGTEESRDFAPVVVAATLVHSLFLELLLARGADPNSARLGLDALSAVSQRRARRAPEHRVLDDPFIELLLRHGARERDPART